MENKCIDINQSDCLFAIRVVVFAEEESKIQNTEMDDKGNKMNKGCFEPMNEILKLPEVSMLNIVKQPVITKKRHMHWMFGYLEAERKRTTRLTKRIKAKTNAQWKVIRGVKEQLAHVVKEQKRKTKQRK